jgi:hypothetical protein
MNNYLKSIKPACYSLIIIIFIEILIYSFNDKEKLYEKIILNNFKSLIYLKEESSLLHQTSLKLSLLSTLDVNTIIIGDSTGYYNFNPIYLDSKSINLASYYFIGWDGFIKILKHNIKHNNKLKNVIISLNPNNISQKNIANNFVNDQLDRLFYSPFKSVNYSPSIAYRELIFNQLFYYPLRIEHENNPFKNSIKYLLNNNPNKYLVDGNDNNLIKNFFNFYHGWFPLTNKSRQAQYDSVFCSYYRFNEDFEFQDNLTFNLRKLDKFNQIIKKHNLRLIVIFAPVPCIITKKELGFNNQIKNYQLANPDIIFPFELYYNFPIEDFADDIHLLENASIKFSKLINEKIKNYID